MTPDNFLKLTTDMAGNLREMAKKSAFVGLPKEKIGAKVYGGGNTVLSVGATHEYGVGNIPQRSFLRVPFTTKRKELNKVIANQFRAVSLGERKVLVGLGRIGAKAVNISKGAFTTRGYGTWPDITDETKRLKGSSQVLIDTGILRSSINYVIR